MATVTKQPGVEVPLPKVNIYFIRLTEMISILINSSIDVSLFRIVLRFLIFTIDDKLFLFNLLEITNSVGVTIFIADITNFYSEGVNLGRYVYLSTYM